MVATFVMHYIKSLKIKGKYVSYCSTHSVFGIKHRLSLSFSTEKAKLPKQVCIVRHFIRFELNNQITLFAVEQSYAWRDLQAVTMVIGCYGHLAYLIFVIRKRDFLL